MCAYLRTMVCVAVLCFRVVGVFATDIPSAREREELRAVMERHRRATFSMDAGGTAFVICRTNRLLATAGHVAEDIQRRHVYVVMSETGYRYRVGRVWMHPDFVYRNGKSAGSVDIAILQLTGDSPSLPSEWKLCMPGNPESTEGYAVGLSGFSGMGYRGSYGHGKVPMPLFVSGIVSDLNPTMVRDGGTGPRWTMYNTAPSWSGGSGSPVFTSSGVVIGIQVGGLGIREVQEENLRLSFSAVSSDAIWDLVRRSKGSIPGLHTQEASNIRLRSISSDERVRLQSERAVTVPARARELVEEARDLRKRKMYASAIEKLQEATRIAPRWAVPYDEIPRTRAANVGRNRDRMNSSTIWREVEQSARESFRAIELDPTNCRYHDMYGRALCAVTTERGNRAWARSVKRFSEILLAQSSLTGINKARAHSLHSYALRVLGDRHRALVEIDRAIALYPSEPDHLRSKYWVLRAMGRHSEAQRVLRHAESMER